MNFTLRISCSNFPLLSSHLIYDSMFRFTKRRKFILSSFLLTAGLSYIQFGQPANRYLAISLLSFLTIPLFWWSLSEGLTGAVWLMSWILPFFFTIGIGLFYFLLPSSLLLAIPVIVLYFFGLYALFLSENIFSVASLRTIQLYRSASAVSFILTLFISFLLYDTVFSFRLPFYLNGLFVFLISLFLFIHGIWSVALEEKVSVKIVYYSALFSLCLAETAFVLSFWPVTIALGSLFLTTLVYILLGLSQAYLSGRLFKKTTREYLLVGIAVFVILLLYTSWG